MSEPIRVVLAEDHTLVRAGLRALVECVDNVVVVGEAADGAEAEKAVEELRPNLVLMDIAMPKMNGIEVTGRINRSHPDVRVIILSMYATEEYVLQALQAGAAGYLMKDSDLDEVQRAVEFVMSGQTYLSPTVSQHVADYLRRVQKSTSLPAQPVAAQSPSAAPSVSTDLTPRQLEILRLIADGFSTREIANSLTISIKTAETHRANIMHRLNIHDVAGLTRYAMRIGLIS